MAELYSQAGFLQAQGAPLYYEVAGQGHPLLLIHAGVADSRMWDEQFPVFAHHYRTIRYDLRSYGKSQFPAEPFANYEDPVELLKFFGIKKAHVVGISFGGKVALDFTLAYPEMATSLVLVGPSVSGTQPSELVQHFLEAEDAELERGDLTAATELNLRMWVDDPQRTPEQVEPLVRKRIHDMQYHAFTIPIPEEAKELNLQPPAITRLAEIHVPTLVMVGDYGIPDKQVFAQQLADQIPMHTCRSSLAWHTWSTWSSQSSSITSSSHS